MEGMPPGGGMKIASQLTSHTEFHGLRPIKSFSSFLWNSSMSRGAPGASGRSRGGYAAGTVRIGQGEDALSPGKVDRCLWSE